MFKLLDISTLKLLDKIMETILDEKYKLENYESIYFSTNFP